MHIIIIGAGQVGSTLAENLVNEENDITVIDTDAKRLTALQMRLDIGIVEGSGAYPNILRQAGADDADMVIAVTSNDETNIVACQVAYSLFQTPTKIARIRSRHYQSHEELFDKAAMPIDFWISPEQLVTDHVELMIANPGAQQVVNFADGLLQLVAVKPTYMSSMVGKTIAELTQRLNGNSWRVLAIFRDQTILKADADSRIAARDEVFFLAETKHVRAILISLGFAEQNNKRIMIAGGGNIGASLAARLEKNYNLKLIECSGPRTEKLAEELNNTTILLGDVSDRNLLLEENINNVDLFCAVTNNDETNVMACLQAKYLGAKQVMSLVARTAYVELLEHGSEIDVVVSPQQITIGRILRHLRKGDIVGVYTLRKGGAEAIEIIAHGDENTSHVVGRKLAQLKLPDSVSIGAIVREGNVLFPELDEVVLADDHIILLLTARKQLGKLERLFQVRPNFV